MNSNRRKAHALAGTLIALLAFGAAQIASAQEKAKAVKAKTVVDKWRPLDGTYAEPGPEFNLRCGEYGDAQIDWADNSISGGEEDCKIIKLTDTAPGCIRLDTICTSAAREGESYKEITLLKKIDEKTIFLRETQDGKFTRSGARMAYCPEDQQRMYQENTKAGK